MRFWRRSAVVLVGGKQWPASVVLKRLAGYSAKNRFYRANRVLAHILKTEFVLQYMSEPELRGRIRRGLLKVGQLHALARDVFYGGRGRIDARELWEQMNSWSSHAHRGLHGQHQASTPFVQLPSYRLAISPPGNADARR